LLLHCKFFADSIIQSIKRIVNGFFQFIKKNSKRIAHNVPVVCDVLTAAIKELRSNSSGGQNVPEKNRTKARSADCGFA
jgi:hypothetical protein